MEPLCAKVVELVSQTWKMKKFVEKMHTTKIEVSKMKKLPLVEKIAKVSQMKKLQRQVTTLWTQKQKRPDKVAKLQAEEYKFIGIIHLVHEKL